MRRLLLLLSFVEILYTGLDTKSVLVRTEVVGFHVLDRSRVYTRFWMEVEYLRIDRVAIFIVFGQSDDDRGAYPLRLEFLADVFPPDCVPDEY